MKDDDMLGVSYKASPVRRSPTFFVLILVACAWFANELALAWIHDRVPRDTKPLPDIFFSLFPEIQGAIRVAEYVMLLLAVNAVLVMVLHRHRWHVSRRVLFCIALSYFFRAFCVTIFQPSVPSPNTYCAPANTDGPSMVAARVARIFWSAGIEQLRPRELCGDLIVSGHTITIFTSLMAFRQYAPRKLQPLGILYTILAYMALVAILLNRKHYMIDVVLGYFVSTRVFMEYHSLANSFHEGSLHRNPLSASVWAYVLPYLERDVPPPHLLTNQLECPSRCLESLHVPGFSD